jgi:hypothetical protein
VSSRAASRLEAIRYKLVYRYAAGQVDWLSSRLACEGKLTYESADGRHRRPTR